MKLKTRSPKYITELARKMRKSPTLSEKLLWNEIKEKKLDGFKFRNQHPVYRYILDFYCHERLLAIEIDGDIHKNRSDYDEYRDDYLSSMDIETLRIDNEDVFNSIDTVIMRIKNKLYSVR